MKTAKTVIEHYFKKRLKMGYSSAILFSLLWLKPAAANIQSYGYRQVYRVNENNHIGSVLQTTFWETKVRCSATCGVSSQCISFSYNSITKECRTFGEEICYQEDSDLSTNVKYYVKTVKEWLPATPTDCKDVPTLYCSAVYTIYPSGNSFDVFCDLDTAGGPWTIITNRYDGSVDFYRTWNDYKNGFGTLTGEYWLGFEKVRSLLALGPSVRFEMGGWDGSLKYVEYSSFSIGTESEGYRLSYSGFYSPHGLGDMLSIHNGLYFTTFDRDNDPYGGGNCAESAHGAWWYEECIDSNLFGRHMQTDSYQSMLWKYFYGGDEYSAIQTLRMMLTR